MLFFPFAGYVHLSRTGDGADLGTIKGAINDLRATCAAQGINCTIGFGPTLLADVLPGEMPAAFQPYTTFESIDGSGREAKGTQEELLLWLNHDDKDKIWKAQYDARQALAGHMAVARETNRAPSPRSFRREQLFGESERLS